MTKEGRKISGIIQSRFSWYTEKWEVGVCLTVTMVILGVMMIGISGEAILLLPLAVLPEFYAHHIAKGKIPYPWTFLNTDGLSESSLNAISIWLAIMYYVAAWAALVGFIYLCARS